MAKEITKSMWDIIGDTELTPEINRVINALADMCHEDDSLTQLARKCTQQIVKEMQSR